MGENENRGFVGNSWGLKSAGSCRGTRRRRVGVACRGGGGGGVACTRRGWAWLVGRWQGGLLCVREEVL